MAGGPSVPTQALYAQVGVYNGPIPPEGPKTVPVGLDFTAQNSYTVDFTLLQQRKFVSEIQAVFIDNFGNDQPLIITVNGTNQRIVCPPQTQGIFPVFSPNPPRFTVQTTGGVPVGLQFLNVPITCLVWNSAGANFIFTGGGALVVSDAALDSTISNGAVATAPKMQGDGDALIPAFMGNDLFTGTTATNTPQTIIAGSANWFFTFCEVLVSPDAALGSAGEFTVTLKDSGTGTTIAQGTGYLPGSTPVLAQASAPILLLLLENLSVNGKAAGDLTLTCSDNLTSGKVFWNIAGGQTNVI